MYGTFHCSESVGSVSTQQYPVTPFMNHPAGRRLVQMCILAYQRLSLAKGLSLTSTSLAEP